MAESECVVYRWDDIPYGEAEEGEVIAVEMSAAKAARDAVALRKAFDAMRSLAAKYLVSVPRSYLVKGAPGDIDWSDPANLARYVKNVDMGRVLRAFNDPEAASGGSAGA